MTVEEIIKEYLTTNGYDGLCCEDCGCGIDDLAPCGDMRLDCVPAYKDNSCPDKAICEYAREDCCCYRAEKG